jgi:hypothetical protein
MDKLWMAPALAFLALGATGAAAQQSDRVETAIATVAPAAPGKNWGSETIAIEIRADGAPLWTGSLRLGGQYGNASFNQSTNEYSEPCKTKDSSASNGYSSSRQINFSISRRNPQQDRDQFYIYVNWTRPLTGCEGEGSNTYGFNRVLELPPGKTVTIEGTGGMVVKLTRQG